MTRYTQKPYLVRSAAYNLRLIRFEWKTCLVWLMLAHDIFDQLQHGSAKDHSSHVQQWLYLQMSMTRCVWNTHPVRFISWCTPWCIWSTTTWWCKGSVKSCTAMIISPDEHDQICLKYTSSQVHQLIQPMICLINHSMVVQRISHAMYSSGYICREQWSNVYGMHT